jgi:peptide/nickel transport system permease protein
MAGLLIVLAFLVVAAFAPWLAPEHPGTVDFQAVLARSSSTHLLGTDEFGHDEFSRLVWGARASMQVGFLAVGLAMLVAVPVGLAAGYFRGLADSVIARVTDVLLAFPFVIFAIALAAVLGPSLGTATIAIAVAATPHLIRVVRGEALALREANFVAASAAMGAGNARILFRHILPNMSGTLLVQATVLIPRAIIGEATLSFLGLGVRPPGASWGVMLQRAQSYFGQAPRLAVYPGVAIVLAALAFNLLGDELRDVTDPRRGQ